MANPNTLIIAVIYNTPFETIRFLKSIENCRYPDLRVVLVDNSETADEKFAGELESIRLPLMYLKSPQNLGYFGGAEYGLQQYLKENVLPTWILVSNVDIVFDDKEFFTRLSSLSWPENTGVIAPAIISHRWGTDTNPKIMRRYSKKQMMFYKWVCTNSFTQNAYMTVSYIKKVVKRMLKSPGREGAPADGQRSVIYAPHGSCIIFRKNYFEKGGNLRHFSFLFGEEIFVAETARAHGLEVVYDPRLKVSDFEHASTGFFYSKRIAGYMKQSTLDIINHYYT